MKTLKLEDEKALKLYKTGSEELKSILEDSFGKDFFNRKITDKIKSYEDACQHLDIELLSLSDFKFLPKIDQKSAFAFHKLTIISRALNENWTPNWNNGNEYKYYPWFDLSGSGFAFHAANASYWGTASDAGSRLCFKNRELAEYAGRTFTSEYKEFMVL